MGIIFDAVNHRYFKDGDLKPSVGEIVNFYLNIDLSNIPVETLGKAQNRGTDIHLMCDKILTGEDFETFEDFLSAVKKQILNSIQYCMDGLTDYEEAYDKICESMLNICFVLCLIFVVYITVEIISLVLLI